MQVSTASSRTNLSESSKQKTYNLGQSQVFPTKTPFLAPDSNTLSTEKLELPLPGSFDLSKAQSEITLTNQSSSSQEKDEKLSFPEQTEYSGLTKPSSATPESLCQTAPESQEDQIVMSSERTPTPPESGSPQLDQLLSDLEEMKLKFIPETLDPLQSEFSDESPEDQVYEYEDLSPDDRCHTEDSDNLGVSAPSAIQLAEDTYQTNVAVTEPAHFQASIQDERKVAPATLDLTKTSETSVPSSLGSHKDSPVSPAESLSTPESPQRFSFPVDIFQSSTYDEKPETSSKVSSSKVAVKRPSDISEERKANLSKEDSTADVRQSQEEFEPATSSKDLMGVTEEISTHSIQDQSEDASSLSLSDLTPETVTSARHFSFEELMPYPFPGNLETSSDEDRTRTSGQQSEESLTPKDLECFASQLTPVKPKAEMTSSTSDEEYSVPPGYAEISSTKTTYTCMPPEYAEVVQSGADSPTFEYSDPEPYFDCIQGASDFSEPDEPNTRSNGDPHDHLSHPRALEKGNQRVLLSSESEDYEDAPFLHEPLYNLQEENEDLLNSSDESDEEFSLCEASQPRPVCELGAYDDTDKYLIRVR